MQIYILLMVGRFAWTLGYKNLRLPKEGRERDKSPLCNNIQSIDLYWVNIINVVTLESRMKVCSTSERLSLTQQVGARSILAFESIVKDQPYKKYATHVVNLDRNLKTESTQPIQIAYIPVWIRSQLQDGLLMLAKASKLATLTRLIRVLDLSELSRHAKAWLRS